MPLAVAACRRLPPPAAARRLHDAGTPHSQIHAPNLWLPNPGMPTSGRGTVIPAAACLLTLTYLLAGGGGLAPLHSAASATQLWWHSRAGGTPEARPPALHGSVRKLGMVNITYFYPPVAQSCKAERLWWYEAAAGRGDLADSDSARLRRGPCMPCQVYVVSSLVSFTCLACAAAEHVVVWAVCFTPGGSAVHESMQLPSLPRPTWCSNILR